MAHHYTTNSSSSHHANVTSLNNKAIQLVQQGESRAAMKLFLQALNSLKSQVGSNTSSQKTAATAAASESAFVRIALPTSAPSLQGMMTYNTLFGLNPNVDPCAPQQRDGSTACLLFNMAVSHHQRCGAQLQQPQVRVAHLKKAAMTYNMAFQAAQHWKKHTVVHSGQQVLTLAIVNNLLVVHHELSTLCPVNRQKVHQLHTLLRDTLFGQATGDEIHCEELSLFAKNLQRCASPQQQQQQEYDSSSDDQKQASSRANHNSPCKDGSVAAAAQPALVGAHSS